MMKQITKKTMKSMMLTVLILAMASKQKLPDGLAFLHRNGTIPIAPLLIVDNAAPDDESAASEGVGTNENNDQTKIMKQTTK